MHQFELWSSITQVRCNFRYYWTLINQTISSCTNLRRGDSGIGRGEFLYYCDRSPQAFLRVFFYREIETNANVIIYRSYRWTTIKRWLQKIVLKNGCMDFTSLGRNIFNPIVQLCVTDDVKQTREKGVKSRYIYIYIYISWLDLYILKVAIDVIPFRIMHTNFIPFPWGLDFP